MSGGGARTTPGIDVAAFGRWLAAAHPEWAGSAADGGVTASRLAGGLSNLTYRIDGAARPLVLRRPPLGHVLSTAHDMQREFTIISALAGSAVPVPNALAFLDDAEGSAGVGTPFYLMDFVAGPILARPADNAGHSPAALRATSLDLARTLGELHRLDPASVGLADFGRPTGFLERQLRRWAAQYDASRSRDVAELDRLQSRLGSTRPETTRDSLLHGDFRLDNAIVHPDAGDGERIAAVLDWEMATIGDSLLDLGTFSMYWDFHEVTGGVGIGGSAVDPAAGYPEFDELVDVYSSVVGVPVPPLGWYRAFAAYKLAVILEGIHLRFSSGQTVGPGFEQVGSFVVPLAEWGLAQLDATG
ncbi:MAG TPA: phosphotransferase family protein [Pseudolysinimonas sp.]|nr:phosphotransferase family protein [Pseudolysinimonas sp.]